MSKSDAMVVFTCDVPGCQEREEVGLLGLAHRGTWDERLVDKEIIRLGWRNNGDGTHTCHGCVEDQAAP